MGKRERRRRRDAKRPHSHIIPARKTGIVFPCDDRDVWETRLEHFDTTIARGIVDDDDVDDAGIDSSSEIGEQRIETARQQIAHIPRNDHDREQGHASYSVLDSRLICPRSVTERGLPS
jgi:hypothetical protein